MNDNSMNTIYTSENFYDFVPFLYSRHTALRLSYEPRKYDRHADRVCVKTPTNVPKEPRDEKELKIGAVNCAFLNGAIFRKELGVVL